MVYPAAQRILSSIGVDLSNNGMACCPFAPWTHKGGRDSTPSMKITDRELGVSSWKCFACQKSGGRISSLVNEYQWLFGRFSDGWLIMDLQIEEERGRTTSVERVSKMSFDDFMRAKSSDQDIKWPTERPGKSVNELLEIERNRENSFSMCDSDYEKYMVGSPHPYFVSRGVGVEIALRWRLGYDSARGRVLMPVMDRDGNVVGVTGRLIQCPRCSLPNTSDEPLETERSKDGIFCASCGKWVGPKYMHSRGFLRDMYFYGEHDLNMSGDRLVVVESHMSVLVMRTQGFENVVANMGTAFGKNQSHRALSLFQKVCVIGDGDDAGMKFESIASKFLSGNCVYNGIVYPEGTDPADFSSNENAELIGVCCP